jgi:SAM-dependent methyltransferase
LLNTPLTLARKLNYKLFGAPRGYGMPVAVDTLEEQYKTGFYSFLDSVDELANYMVILGYLRHFNTESGMPAPAILDLGCGHGRFRELLGSTPVRAYRGLDLSHEAVRQASEQNFDSSEFIVGDFDEYSTEEKFDFIVSMGAIHYAPDPAATLKRYSGNLTSGGVFVISLWRHGHNSAIWRRLEKHFRVVECTIVTNKKGVSWDIKALRPKCPR